MMNFKLVIIGVFILNFSFSQREIWGTVKNTGQYNYGYIFKTDSIGDNIEIVHQFDNTEGRFPGQIIQAFNGKLYGLTERGGEGELTANHKGGVLYEYDPAIDSFRVLVHFSANNPVFPYDGPRYLDGLIEATPGMLYGSVVFGGLQNGFVFSFDISSSTLSNVTSIPTFQGGGLNTTQGNRLNGPLFSATDGYLYSTTSRYSQCPISQPDRGSIIKVNPNTGNFSYSYINPCSGDGGYYYYSNFIETNGSLYAVAPLGGVIDKGVIYQYTLSNGTYTKKHDFQGGTLGESPTLMTQAINGKFYGIASGGLSETNLPQGGGILFEYDPVSGSYTKKTDFILGNGWIGNVGPFPFHLINSQNGKLYGATGNGIFEYDTQTNLMRAASRFYPVGGTGQVAMAHVVEICKFPAYNFPLNTDFVVCKGDNFSYNLGTDNTTSFVWKHDGITDPLQFSEVLSLTDINSNHAGTWIAELTNECGTTVTEPIHINLVPDIVVVQNDNLLEVTSGGDSYQWIDCSNQVSLSGENSNIYVANQSGFFAVEVSNNQCLDTSECYLISIALIENELANDNIIMYPNPVAKKLNVKADNKIQSISIYDTFGKIIISTKDEEKIDVSMLTKGLYILTVETEKEIWKSKFLKE